MRQSRLVRLGGLLSVAIGAAAPAMLHAQLPSLLDTSATQIAAGQYHTCALTSVGGVQCWGQNLWGQLGNSTNTDTYNPNPAPVDVPGLTGGVAAIAAGGDHTCALTDVGGVKCWGRNAEGELGNSTNSGTSNANPAALDVTGLTGGAAAIAVGGYHACALTTAGGVKCWGYNHDGELGNSISVGTPTNAVPADVDGLSSGVVAIAAGWQHTCALTAAGGVMCWGYNYDGELGNSANTGTSNANPTPLNVTGLSGGVKAITASGYHTCALTLTGGVKCWGLNDYGQLGNDTNNGTYNANPLPADVAGLTSGVTAIATGGYHTCALMAVGGVKCWGYDYYGQIGDGAIPATYAPNPAPLDVSLSSDVVAITAGATYTCALTVAGGVKCWGYNYDGELGSATNTGTYDPAPMPADATGFSTGVGAIVTGGFHTCALTAAGGVKCWGRNYNGQLGNDANKGTYNPNPAPSDVTGLLRGMTAITAGKTHTCALTAAGGVQCWGYNGEGELGNSLTAGAAVNPVPADVDGLTSGVTAIVAGGSHTCALTTAYGVKCWGLNFNGQLGNATNAYSYNPNPAAADVAGLTSGVQAITAGGSHTCALMITGGVKCWGADVYGQLGDGAYGYGSNPDPTDVVDLTSGVAAISAGEYHTCALMITGGVKCWGSDEYSALGYGAGGIEPTPVDVISLDGGVSAIAAGGYHSCALLASGGAKCWGYNLYGEFGNGERSTSGGGGDPFPSDVLSLGVGLADIVAGQYHTCVLDTIGHIQCWGLNSDGELGNNDAPAKNYRPVAILSARSINFAPAATIAIGGSLTLSATASDGSAVSFDTWTPDTCSVSGTTVTAIAFALCGVRASLPGGGPDSSGNTFAGAPQQLRLIEVVPDQIFANGFDLFIVF